MKIFAFSLSVNLYENSEIEKPCMTFLYNVFKAPGVSGISIANRDSTFSPINVLSAMNCSLSKERFAPELIQTTFKCFFESGSKNFFFEKYLTAPATANAPAGSQIFLVSSKIDFIAAQILSLLTLIISSTCSLTILNVCFPYLFYSNSICEYTNVF